MATHTPGPWEAKGWQVFHSIGERNIGVVCYTATNKKNRTPRAAADARLIAAAPDLLEALKGLIEAVVRDSEEKGISGFTGARLDDARAAIAKVTS